LTTFKNQSIVSFGGSKIGKRVVSLMQPSEQLSPLLEVLIGLTEIAFMQLATTTTEQRGVTCDRQLPMFYLGLLVIAEPSL
jgi:hypothetical protein